MSLRRIVVLLLLILTTTYVVEYGYCFSLVMMGTKRGKSNLKKILNEESTTTTSNSNKSMNNGRGQEITGVTLPEPGKAKGWEFGNNVKMVCANVGIENQYYALQGNCPRCGFDLWKGTLLVNDPAWEGTQPCIACPTCSTTFSLKTGKYGPVYKRSGLQGFVNNLAKSATTGADAKAYLITKDTDTGKIYCRER